MTGKTFLFIGFSFSDPNLEQVLSQIRQRYEKSQREHFALLRKPKESDFKTKTDFIYAEVSQTHYINDLRRYNVTVLLIDEYSDVTETLRMIEHFYRRRSVFVGGSGVDFTPWAELDVNEFLYSLGAMLVDHNIRIVSGFGLGVGNALISGAIDRAYAKGLYHLDDFLDVRPFPRAIQDEKRRTEVWDSFRRDLLSLPGIAIFLFGNKKVNEEIILADGLKKEFDIAREQNVLTVPIGGTGSMAKVLGEETLRDFEHYFKGQDAAVKNRLIELQRPRENLNEYLEEIQEIIKMLADQ
ncbi:MAG: SIR2 family protein [Burkholderiaceae bacterium]